jgi:CxxC motif-containing protein (DUF1111 family)
MTEFDLRFSLALFLALGACTNAPLGYDPDEERSGGDTTVFDDSADSYNQPAQNLDFDQRGDFEVGNNFNSDDWVVAPATTTTRDGLGPVYHATSCSSCHPRDGRGQPPADGEEMLSLLVRLSIPGTDEHGAPMPEPTYGLQFQARSVPGVPSEGSTRLTWTEVPGAYADGTPYSLRYPTLEFTELTFGPMDPTATPSLRVSRVQYGIGLLEAITDDDMLAHADPDDADGDGISGRPNHVWDPARREMTLGRLGWKANVANVRAQTAHALLEDMGITSSIFPDQNCGPTQTECLAAPTGGEPEATDQVLDLLVFYGQTLAVPARRDFTDPEVLRGREIFHSHDCVHCHAPEHTTGAHDIAELSGQHIWPYTDLLLHDMGEGLADHRTDYEASGREWRTPPLWGVGLLETVNHHQFLLHDGRARGFAEAILWHDGEALRAREDFRNMSATDRAALIRFLESL